MSALYPTALADLDEWRHRNKTTLDEARKRFAQFVVLECIATLSTLRGVLAFKGGNALRFVYGNPRSTTDLDFTATKQVEDDESALRTRLSDALRTASRFGLKMKVQSVKRNPKKKDATLPTFQITIGYQLPSDRLYADFERTDRPVPTVIEVEISLNDSICETREHSLVPSGTTTLLVCSIEDILAEKLRALLQQPIRNRSRPQDVFDIARVFRSRSAELDYENISKFFAEKCAVRMIEPRKSAFDNPEVRDRAQTGYDDLVYETTDTIIPFDEAWQAVADLVARLSLSDA